MIVRDRTLRTVHQSNDSLGAIAARLTVMRPRADGAQGGVEAANTRRARSSSDPLTVFLIMNSFVHGSRLPRSSVMKLTIDARMCTGHGRCYSLAPDVLTDDAAGFVAERGTTVAVTGAHEAAARDAALSCPEGAITLED